MHYNCYYIKGLIDQQREKKIQKQNKTKHDQQQRNNNNKKKTRNGQIFDKLVNLVVWKGEDCWQGEG